MPIVDDGPYCPWIRLAGHARRPRAWTFVEHYNSDWFLAMTTEGEEWIEHAGERHCLPAGHGFVLPPGTVFSRGAQHGSHAWYLHCHLLFRPDRQASPDNHRGVDFADSVREHVQPGAQAVFGMDLPLCWPEALRPRLGGLLQSIIHTYQSSPEDHQHCQGELTLFFAELCAWALAQRQENDVATRIARAEEIANRSLDQDFDIRAFAAAAGWKPSRFHALYRNLRGTTPHHFLKERRMAQARRLLRDPSLSIGTVASLVGHPNATSFGRLFRQAHGCTPSEWRQHAGITG